MPTEEIVKKLEALLGKNNTLREAVEQSLDAANRPGIKNLDEFYHFLDGILTHIPPEQELMPSVREFYYVLSKGPGTILKTDEAFNSWIQEFIDSRGNFMDQVELAAAINTFIENPEYNMQDYIPGPSGWKTYNQFLARQLKAGVRPIAGAGNDDIIVSPADSEFKGVWPINSDSALSVKGTMYSISELLADSSYKDHFKDGLFTHSFLSISDYHRYHVPVTGIVREVKKIPSKTWVNETEKDDGLLENTDDVGFQFSHTRGFIVMESAVGLVVIMPVGMGHISSVNFIVEEGMHLVKGAEFGYFAFGGSDIIMMFERAGIKYTAKENNHYKQGEQVALKNEGT